jgi:hypothetical protein
MGTPLLGIGAAHWVVYHFRRDRRQSRVTWARVDFHSEKARLDALSSSFHFEGRP